jgi:hypothetical protein
MPANLSRNFINCVIKEKGQVFAGAEGKAKLFVHADAFDIFMMSEDN